jgi:hypothetical protein
MSSIATLHRGKNENLSIAIMPRTISSIMWTEPVDTTTFSERSFTKVQSTSLFEICDLVDRQAQSITASFYKTTQFLSRTVNLTSLSSLTSNLLQEEDHWEDDPWIEMPPRSIRRVVMNVKRMGRGKPLDFDWDDVLAEE